MTTRRHVNPALNTLYNRIYGIDSALQKIADSGNVVSDVMFHASTTDAMLEILQQGILPRYLTHSTGGGNWTANEMPYYLTQPEDRDAVMEARESCVYLWNTIEEAILQALETAKRVKHTNPCVFAVTTRNLPVQIDPEFADEHYDEYADMLADPESRSFIICRVVPPQHILGVASIDREVREWLTSQVVAAMGPSATDVDDDTMISRMFEIPDDYVLFEELYEEAANPQNWVMILRQGLGDVVARDAERTSELA